MTGPVADDALRGQLAEALPHEPWCNREAPDLGDDDLACAQNRLALADALLPTVRAAIADEIEQLADQRAWVTQHDNEVVSTRDLYERVALLRGELQPVSYDFPPDAATGEQG